MRSPFCRSNALASLTTRRAHIHFRVYTMYLGLRAHIPVANGRNRPILQPSTLNSNPQLSAESAKTREFGPFDLALVARIAKKNGGFRFFLPSLGLCKGQKRPKIDVFAGRRENPLIALTLPLETFGLFGRSNGKNCEKCPIFYAPCAKAT